jgi:hypothetical protein
MEANTGTAFILSPRPCTFLEGGDSDRVESDCWWVSFLGLGKMDLSTFEADLAPIEAVLIALICVLVWMDIRK